MTIRVAINGYGRIGRNVLRAIYESGKREQIIPVAINDLWAAEISAHLTQFDSVHGKFQENISLANNDIMVGNDKIRTFSETDPAKLPWKELDVDIVYECTGLFTAREKAALHLQAGARKVIISSPAPTADATIVYGINHQNITVEHQIISCASCTTNCLAPVVYPLNQALGIESGLMTTIHAYTNDQHLCDVHHKDPYRARSATQSMIPTKTGAATALGLVLPELEGKFDGMAVRVPTLNVSLVDLSFISKTETTIEQVNDIIKQAADEKLKGVLAYNQLPLVSIDFNHNPASSIFDFSQTKVNGKLVKVMAWYDNEWGFSNRMLDNSLVLMAASSS